jgi:hypothetical protein
MGIEVTKIRVKVVGKFSIKRISLSIKMEKGL